MRREDEFSAWLTGALLRTSGDEIQSLVLDDLVEKTAVDGDLLETASQAARHSRRPGDFGMEIAGSVAMSVLIEAGKLVWQAYAKKIAEKAAEASVEAVKSRVRRAWKGDGDSNASEDLAISIRAAGAKQGLPSEEIEKLILAVQERKLADELNPS